jgi:hypothetical protein
LGWGRTRTGAEAKKKKTLIPTFSRKREKEPATAHRCASKALSRLRERVG